MRKVIINVCPQKTKVNDTTMPNCTWEAIEEINRSGSTKWKGQRQIKLCWLRLRVIGAMYRAPRWSVIKAPSKPSCASWGSLYLASLAFLCNNWKLLPDKKFCWSLPIASCSLSSYGAGLRASKMFCWSLLIASCSLSTCGASLRASSA